MPNNQNIGVRGLAPTVLGVDNHSGWYDEMSIKWKKVDALLGGTDSMRRQSKTYLPQFPIETEDLYEWRKNTAVLTNFFKHMADQMVGKIFQKAIEIKSPIPIEILNDIDRQGSSVHTIGRQLAFDIITKGMSHIFIDYPKLEGPITAREVKNKNIRPFWIRVPPENLFAANSSRVNDDDELSQVRWTEIGTDVLSFEERQFERIRALSEKYKIDDDGKYVYDESGKPIKIGYEWQVWEQQSGRLFPIKMEKIHATSGSYALVDRGDFGLSKLPLVTAYADRNGFYTSTLPLEDVAYLNILHWQASSDLNNIIRLSQAPLFFMRGFKDRPEAKGANIVYFAEGEGDEIQHADMKYVEPTGKGIEAGENYLTRIVQEAQMIGMRMFERSRSVETAVGEQLEKIEDASPLQLIALSLESQIKRALDFTCEWLDLPKENEVKVNKDFAFTGDEGKAADHIALAYANGAITKATYIEHLKEYGILKQSVNVLKEAAAAEEEMLKRIEQNSKSISQNTLKSPEGAKGVLNIKKNE